MPVGVAGAETVTADARSVSPAEPAPVSFSDGRYKVGKFLGEGGTKKVYLVHDTLLDRPVAFALIKTSGLTGDDRRRILHEAQTMAKLGENPNIVPIFEFGEQSGQPFMVLPVMAGGSVEELIKEAQEGQVDIDTVLRLARDVAKGLEFAHADGVIHRDLKPGNVWLTADGVAKIGDFGIALSPTYSRMTQSQMVLGTVAYMAPEQAMGGEVDERSDLYSLGAMLFELVTGAPPFRGHHPVAVIGQHINASPAAPSHHNPACPLALEALILKLLAKDEGHRPQSASEVIAAVDEIGRSISHPQPKPSPGEARNIPLRVLIVEDSEDDAGAGRP